MTFRLTGRRRQLLRIIEMGEVHWYSGKDKDPYYKRVEGPVVTAAVRGLMAHGYCTRLSTSKRVVLTDKGKNAIKQHDNLLS
jgi:hypothetical protein